ncbi:MAG: N-acyl homoserine lactonase family protein [Saccharofermentanales bacterium]
MTTWTIRPINTGYVTTVPKQYIYHHSVVPYRKDIPDERIYMPAFTFLLEKGNQKIMVDTGMSWSERADKYHHPKSIQPEGMAIHEQFSQRGYDPAEVDAVIFTHLHWDHVYYMDRFTNAEFFVHQKEYDFAMDPIPLYYKSYEHPALGIRRQFEGFNFSFVKNEQEIAPGIRVFDTPGHSPGHISVEIETNSGNYICCGDSIFMWVNLDPVEELHYNITPPGRYADVISTWKSIELQKERVKSKEFILPSHERALEELVKKNPIIS